MGRAQRGFSTTSFQARSSDARWPMSSNGFCWWTPEEIAEINRVAAPRDGNFAKLRAQAFEAVMAAHREIHLASAAQSVAQSSLGSNQQGRSRRAEVARSFLIELKDAIRTTRKKSPRSVSSEHHL